MKLINYYKRLNKQTKIMIKLIVIIILLVPTITLSRYVYKFSLDHFYKTKNFYFKSDLLTEKDPSYTISNWSGVDDYVLTINMNSILNEYVSATSDIKYNIEFECDDTITCELSKSNGLISVNNLDASNNNRDYFSLTVTPKRTFSNNEEAHIRVVTSSTSPYKKTLSANFVLKVEKVGLYYEITDNKNDIFALLRITNSLTYYTVIESFLDYEVGDELESEIYYKLSEENKRKCSSMLVDISFDPRVVRLDMTNAYYLNALELGRDYYSSIKLRSVVEAFDSYQEGDLISNDDYNDLSDANKLKVSNEYEYINGFKVNLDAISSADIKFYKRDKSKDYTYPYVNSESIVEVK